MNIDYHLISHAITSFTEKGYQYIDTPWFVNQEILDVTLPNDRQGFYLGHPTKNTRELNLVGSAEQGFLQLMLEKQINCGKFCSAGPCFRDEPIIDELHQLNFFKLELINIVSANHLLNDFNIKEMMFHAKETYIEIFKLSSKYINELQSIETDHGYDLILKNIEIGSYGIRKYSNFCWIYGTGLALPRAQIALKKI